jgi:hypothetical protein
LPNHIAMTKPLILLLIASTFISCKSNTKQTIKETTTKTSSDNFSADLITTFKQVLQGEWVKIDYIEKLNQTRSPYNSWSELTGVAAMSLETDSIKADSLIVGESLNNHEGTNFTIYFRQGHKFASLKISLKDYDTPANFFELGYVITSVDTSLFLYHYNNKNQILDSIKYTRVLHAQLNDDMSSGIEYITNKTLITGEYILTDSLGAISKVELKNDGKVSGFLGFKTYYINTDFMAGPQNNLDVIDFDVNTDNQKEYGYKINSNTISLFTTKSNADSTKLLLDKLAYKLVRTK